MASSPWEAQAGSGQETSGRLVEILSHHLRLELVPDDHRLIATDRLTLKNVSAGLREVTLSLSEALTMTRVTRIHGSQADPLTFTTERLHHGEPPSTPAIQLVTVKLDHPLKVGQVIIVECNYEGIMNDPPRQSPHLRFVAPSQTSGHIGKEGIYLSGESHWYPEHERSVATYEVEVTLPQGWEAVTHGQEVSRQITGGHTTGTWRVKGKTEALTLVANRFARQQRTWRGLELSTYLLPENAALAEVYLGAMERYLDLYIRLLGSYPFPKFAVVENFFPSGLGMPSFTLLGSGVIKRRYIQPYALGHEIVHSWIGNWVFNDIQQGNWVEGLTTYLANYYYEELTGTPEKAREQRRMMLLGYAVYVEPQEDYPLRSFQEKQDQKDNAIGYQKAAMVFHMLRQEIGDEAFWEGIRNFVAHHAGLYATWQDLEREFSSAARQDLRWFFRQWVERSGAPTLQILETAVDPQSGEDEKAGNVQIMVRLRQLTEGEGYRMHVPLEVLLEGGRIHQEILPLEQADQALTFTVPGRPRTLRVDPGFEIFRRLPRRTLPPMLNLYVTDRVRSLVLPSGGTDADRRPYEQLAQRMSRGEGQGIQQTKNLGALDDGGSVLILGGPDMNPAVDWAVRGCGEGVNVEKNSFSVGGRTYEGEGMALLMSCRHPDRRDSIVSMFYGLSPSAAAKVARLLFFYGWQSYIVFRDGTVVTRGDISSGSHELEVHFSVLEHR